MIDTKNYIDFLTLIAIYSHLKGFFFPNEIMKCKCEERN